MMHIFFKEGFLYSLSENLNPSYRPDENIFSEKPLSYFTVDNWGEEISGKKEDGYIKFFSIEDPSKYYGVDRFKTSEWNIYFSEELTKALFGLPVENRFYYNFRHASLDLKKEILAAFADYELMIPDKMADLFINYLNGSLDKEMCFYVPYMLTVCNRGKALELESKINEMVLESKIQVVSVLKKHLHGVPYGS